MTTPRVTVPVEPEGVSPVYNAAYDTIRKGAPGLSDATCAAIARSINMKVSHLPAAPAPEGGSVDYGVRTEGAPGITEPDPALATREEAPAGSAHPCYDEHQPGCDCVIPAQKATPIPSFLGRMTAPAEAGEDDLAARLRHAETWDLDADQEARDRCGVLMLEAAEHLEALRAQPQAREDAQPFMFAYEDVDKPGEWQAFRHQIRRPDGSICPGRALYTHPAPDALRVREAVSREIKAWADTRWPKSHRVGSKGWVNGLTNRVLVALQAEQKGGAA